MYDVLVVGAGPGGSTCAYYLACQGYSVALVDKKQFPRDKPCGGGISPNLFSKFPHLNKRRNDFLESESHIAVLHSSNQRIAVVGKVDLDMMLRTKFDNTLYEMAVTQGAEPITGNRVRSVSYNDESVTVSLAGGKTLDGRTIIGADGVGSIVARETGLHTRWPSTAITACQVTEIPVSESEILDIYSNDREYHFFANVGGQPGYGWIFPKRTTVNVGLGIVGKYATGLPNKYRQFVKLLVRKKLLPSQPDLSRVQGSLVPTGGTVSQTYANRCLLVGDSAGMVNPITGGGIHLAMLAGNYAAAVLGMRLESGDLSAAALSTYQLLWMQGFGKTFPYLVKIQKLVTSSLFDVLLEIGNRDKQIQQIISAAMAGHVQGNVNVLRLAFRTLYVILREALT